MRKFIALIVSLMVMVIASLFINNTYISAETAGTAVTIDGSIEGCTYEGLGAASAGASSRLLVDYPEPYRSDILDFLFKPDFGAGFQHLKVEIGGDINSTDGTEPSHARTREELANPDFNRGYEYWLLRMAKDRNPDIYLDCLEWGTPGWFNGGFYSQDNADYIVQFIKGAKSAWDLDIDYTGIWNETDWNRDWIVNNLRPTLDNKGLSGVKIVAPDSVNNWDIVNIMNNDQALKDAVDVVGVHYPGYNSTQGAKDCGKPLWSSEDGPWRGDWSGAGTLAKMYNRNYISGKMTKAIIWSPITSYYEILPLPNSGAMKANTPWTGYYEIQPAVWATAHTTQFAKPGWKYIDSGCGYMPGGGSYVTLKPQNSSDYSVVIETIDAPSSQTITFNLTGGLSNETVHVWRTNSNSYFQQLEDITPVDGSFTITLDGQSIYSITTTTGQKKGESLNPIPSNSAFPMPYAEDFESYAAGETPKYTQDQAGAFETTDNTDGDGKYLRQVISRKGIQWHYHNDPDPFTVLGDRNWDNYEVSTDVYVEDSGYVSLFGRIENVQQNTNPPVGYGLYVDHNGNWQLKNFGSTIVSGQVPFSANAWHNLKFRFNYSNVIAFVDGVEVANEIDESHSRGMIGVGSGWNNARYDNLSVQPFSGPPPVTNPYLIPRYQMIASATSEAGGYEAGNAIDGDVSTMWHTQWNPAPPLPQSITLNLGGTYDINKLRYLPRQDTSANGIIAKYKVYVSTDGANFTEVASGNWAEDKTEKSTLFTPVSASYVKLEAIDAVVGYVSAAEINIEKPSTPPQASNVTIAGTAKAGETLRGSYTYTDPNEYTERSSKYKWLQADAVNSEYLAIEGETSITFTLTEEQAGKFIKFEVTPVNRFRIEGPPVQSDPVKVEPLPPFNAIPHSQMTATATSEAGFWGGTSYEAAKAIDDNTSTFWHTAFMTSGNFDPLDELPQSITLNLGGTYKVDKLKYLPRQDMLNGTITEYRIYVSADGTNFTQVAGGNWSENMKQKFVAFTPTMASFVKLEAVQGKKGYAAAAEINIGIVDTDAPTITVTGIADGDAVKLNQQVTVTWEASDALSGIETAVGDITSGAALDTSSVGDHTLTFTATDKAGNTTTKSITYHVQYDFSGVHQPLKTEGPNTFKLGRTIPVKFQLKDASGAYVTSAVAKLYIASVTDTVVGDESEAASKAASNGNTFRYDKKKNQYIFNLNTRDLQPGTYQIRIDLGDGTKNTVIISLE